VGSAAPVQYIGKSKQGILFDRNVMPDDGREKALELLEQAAPAAILHDILAEGLSCG
jgi:hypothetical protein